MGKRINFAASIFAGGAICAALLFATGAGEPVQAATSKPNIVFVILDDVGIDQLYLPPYINNGGVAPPHMPNLQLIANHAVTFTNVWALPECSPSRSAFFTGRYSLRTGVDAVISSTHLPQTYMSQFEATLPNVLAKAGYKSSLIGKYHLGNDLDPARNCAPTTRGFNYFKGSMTPGPTSVDTTAGGVAPSGSQVCGYYQTKAAGSCYTQAGDREACAYITAANAAPGTDPARTCLQRGGIFVPNKACRAGAPPYSAFSRTNAYYVWPSTTLPAVQSPLYVNPGKACGSTIDRRYMTDAQGQDGVAWWKTQSGPRMLTLSFNTIHTPLQKPPTTLVPDPLDAASTCSNLTPPRDLLNMMLESADVEIGRTLAQLGLATLAPNGSTLVSLNLGNTLLVIVGDNGSQGAATRAPFNLQRAKGTVYQTGIWVPLIVAGPMVALPGRSVDAMVNAVDLYQLFGSAAGVDVNTLVPPSHVLDSQPMLPYLTNASAPVIRQTNYSQLGVGTFSPDPSKRNWPCMIGNVCNDTLVDSKSLCENDNSGTWYGPGGKKQLSSCCAVRQDQALQGNTSVTLAPVHQYTMRGGSFRGVQGAFKLVEMQSLDCSKPITNPSQKAFPWAEYQMGTPTQEFYDLTLKTTANPQGLDNAGSASDLSQNCPANSSDLSNCLPTQIDVTNYTLINAQLQAMKSSANAQISCTAMGDGNMDMRINQTDLDNWKIYNGKGPSRYDINGDGKTDQADYNIIKANLNKDCLTACQRADLDRNKKIDSADMQLLTKQTGACTDQIFCSGDLNGDGKVDSADVTLMTNAQKTCK